MSTNADSLLLERDLLAHILELGHHQDPTSLLDEALQIVMRMSGARHGWIELERAGALARFAASTDALEAERVRRALSSTIIKTALAEGHTVQTRAAFDDPRFAEAPSVQSQHIDAVICVPIGGPVSRGVLYLQGSRDGRMFAAEVVRHCELFARHLGNIASVVLRHGPNESPDPTARWRARLAGSEAIIGSSLPLAEVLKAVAAAAPLDVGVLVTGPSGSGKTAIAKLIASNGPRARKPFVALSCANLPVELVESELFGALPGSHSTAHRKVIGKVASADGGTLFLDEIGELAAPAQAKLLQFLQDGTYFPLGGARMERADVRIIAATNAHLAERVKAGTFREDLYYRLCIVEIAMPPLEDRRLDIRDLAVSLLAGTVARLGLPRLVLSTRAIAALECADWPGNVRQLKHCLDAAAVRAMADETDAIEPAHLFPGRPVPDARSTYHEIMRGHQKLVLQDALNRHQGNVTAAAEALGLGRSSLYQMVKTLGLDKG